MDNYKNMYYTLFNAISDAIDEHKRRDYEKMLHILMTAQQMAEDEFNED